VVGKGRPRDIEAERNAAFEAEEGGGEVLDLVGHALHLAKPGAGPLAPAARSEFGVGGGGDRNRSWLAEQPEGKIQDVNAEVDQRPAA
jgi:hypothetical protein